LLGAFVALACDEGKEVEDINPMAEARLVDEQLACSLETISDGEAVVVKMSLTNNGDIPVSVSPQGTAWDNGTSVFNVESASERIAYKGISAYRGPFASDEYINVAPGASVSKEYALSGNYPIDNADDYSVNLVRKVFDVEISGEQMTLQHNCGELMVYAAPATIRQVREPLTYVSCSTNRTNLVERAIKPTVYSMMTDVQNAVKSGHPIYTEWFGTWSTARGNTVSGVFDDIDDKWDTWEIDCAACENPSWNAYVNRGQDSNRVHLCVPYWSLPSFSIEAGSSQAGVFIHELSHLESETKDYVYNADPARNLAVTNPDNAVDNAENYEHFSSHQYLSRIIAVLL
jgi:peptidyl-Lys metalloendopeptidase